MTTSPAALRVTDQPRVSWSGRGWSIDIGEASAISFNGTTHRLSLDDLARVAVRRRLFTWRCQVPQLPEIRLRGLRRQGARAVRSALQFSALLPDIARSVEWHREFTGRLDRALSQHRWFTTESLAELLNAAPSTTLHVVTDLGCEQLLTPSEINALKFIDSDHAAIVAEVNGKILDNEKFHMREFFASIESQPLTDEQIDAVATYDNRVQLLAAAGSGKTSVMVARAAYAIARGFTTPDRILLLAFNTTAAAELQTRVTQRFAAAGIPSEGVTASTFHSFGLKLIAEHTGRKPRVPKWVEKNNGIDAILEISESLKTESDSYRYKWDLFRTVFAPAPTSLEFNEPDSYDRESRETGYATFRGEQVRSHGERTIADFLFLNGVNYEYEAPYTFPTADSRHGQYHPDFYYPDIDVWHEHWALDANGRPPKDFHGYAESMKWKKATHKRHGTRLIETTWFNVLFGNGLAELQSELERLGVTFDWDPTRSSPGRGPRRTKDADLAQLIRTFMTHVKSNSLTREELMMRLRSSAESGGPHGYRSQLFLELYWPIHEAWNERLRHENAIDFEDMLCSAADILASTTCDPGFDLILVDEFQDASQARARLVAGLVRQPGRHLLAVGDDWQAINRFAGADISVMTKFQTWFGEHQQLALTKTFRCPPAVSEVAAKFVGENPSQISKSMTSTRPDSECLPRSDQVQLRAGDTNQCLSDALREISARHPNEVVSVDVLARYNLQLKDASDALSVRPKNVRLTFRTVHRSKGLEADYIVVLGLETGHYGFPSTITDDPVLTLAMPYPEGFEHAEERRLLYVALTRARRQVILVVSPSTPSPFAAELTGRHGLQMLSSDGQKVTTCPSCAKGILVERRSQYGKFLGCTNFPACRHAKNVG